MDMVSTANAPRIVFIAKRVYWIRALTFEDFTILLGWLDDILPGRNDRKMPPPVSSPEAQAAIQSPEGKMLLVWLGLRHQGYTFEKASELSDGLSELEYVRWLNVLYSHRRTMTPSEDSDDTSDIAATWCSKGMAKMALKIGVPGMLGLSLDQFEWLQREGDMDDENPAYSPESLAQVQADFEAKWGEKIRALQVTEGTS